MKNLRRIGVLSAALLLVIATSSFLTNGGVNTKFGSQNFAVTVKGTSTLHDWEMKSGKGRCDIVFTMDASDRATSLTELRFTVDAESIKSEHSIMDNNAYKALKTKSFKTINFILSSATLSPLDATTYLVKANGILSIAGVSKRTDLVATAKYNAADKSFTVNGAKKMKMTEYGVTPPTVMFGTIKTGDDLTIVFNAKVTRN
jgi:polyisoprenoid-binding protein YceI